jgi:antitoxin component YwqK of YwqJK toxin-antitoxin module
MKRIFLLIPFCLLCIVYANAQDAIPHSALPVDYSEGRASIEYYFGSPLVQNNKTYVASLFRTPAEKLATFSFVDKKLSKKDGAVVGYNGKGDTQFIGNYQRNKLFGEWNSWYENRVRCDSGRLVNDMPDGEWKSWYPDGKLRFILYFNAAKLAALKDEIRRQPKIRFFAIAELPLEKALQSVDAATLFGNPVNTRHGLFATKKLNRKNYDELTLKSRVDQNTLHVWSDKYLPPFAECLLHGSFASFYRDSRIKETGMYLNGLREGLWEEFSEKENIRAIGTYVRGQKKGEWRYYNRDKLLELKIFDARGREKQNHEFITP